LVIILIQTIKEEALLRSFCQKYIMCREIMIINLNIVMKKNKTTAVTEKIKKPTNTADQSETNHIKVLNKFLKLLAYLQNQNYIKPIDLINQQQILLSNRKHK
jgi:hypothetical protein